jgi:hypothetical protein
MRPTSTSPTILFSTVRNPPLVTSQQVRTISTQNDGRETCACHVSPELAGDLPTHLSLSGPMRGGTVRQPHELHQRQRSESAWIS